MDHEVVSKRNLSMMNKHKLTTQRSTGPDGTGNGLFTAAALEAKTVLHRIKLQASRQEL